ncbi:MAG: hypothetical protein ACTHM4_13755 [Rhodanobacteraceae bacterium]
MLGILDSADQQQAPRREACRMRGVDAITTSFEHCLRSIERLGRPGEIARHQRDLRFGHHTSRPCDVVPGAEGLHRLLEKLLGASEIAKLRHRDAAQRQCGRVVAQGDPLQGTERIAGREGLRRGGDQRIHRNPVTLVTPTHGLFGARICLASNKTPRFQPRGVELAQGGRFERP